MKSLFGHSAGQGMFLYHGSLFLFTLLQISQATSSEKECTKMKLKGGFFSPRGFEVANVEVSETACVHLCQSSNICRSLTYKERSKTCIFYSEQPKILLEDKSHRYYYKVVESGEKCLDRNEAKSREVFPVDLSLNDDVKTEVTPNISVYFNDELPLTNPSPVPKFTSEKTSNKFSTILSTLLSMISSTKSTPSPVTISDDFPFSSQFDFEKAFDDVETDSTEKAFDKFGGVEVSKKPTTEPTTVPQYAFMKLSESDNDNSAKDTSHPDGIKGRDTRLSMQKRVHDEATKKIEETTVMTITSFTANKKNGKVTTPRDVESSPKSSDKTSETTVAATTLFTASTKMTTTMTSTTPSTMTTTDTSSTTQTTVNEPPTTERATTTTTASTTTSPKRSTTQSTTSPPPTAARKTISTIKTTKTPTETISSTSKTLKTTTSPTARPTYHTSVKKFRSIITKYLHSSATTKSTKGNISTIPNSNRRTTSSTIRKPTIASTIGDISVNVGLEKKEKDVLMNITVVIPDESFRNENHDWCLRVFVNHKHNTSKSPSFTEVTKDAVSMNTEASCRSACVNSSTCQAVEWNSFNSTCLMYDKLKNFSPQETNGFNLYVKITCPNAPNTNVVLSTTPTYTSVETSTINGCNNNVTILKKFKSGSQYGGIRQDGFHSEDECQSLCMTNTKCAGVDYTLWEKSCWLHYSTNQTSHNNNTCCNHYKKVQVCTYECFTAKAYHRGKGVALETLIDFAEQDCKEVCKQNRECRGFEYNKDKRKCQMFSKVDRDAKQDSCCTFWLKEDCTEPRDDIVLIMATTIQTEMTILSSTPTFTIFGLDHTTAPVLTSTQSASDAFLSPISLVVIIACLFAFIVGIGSLVGFIVHRRNEKNNNRVRNHLRNNSNSLWMSDLGYPARRQSLAYWYADNPSLDLSDHVTSDGTHGSDRNRYIDCRGQRHSYAGHAATSPWDDPYLEALNSFCTYRHPINYHRPTAKHPLYPNDIGHRSLTYHRSDVGQRPRNERRSERRSENRSTLRQPQATSSLHRNTQRSTRKNNLSKTDNGKSMKYGVWYHPPSYLPSADGASSRNTSRNNSNAGK